MSCMNNCGVVVAQEKLSLIEAIILYKSDECIFKIIEDDPKCVHDSNEKV